MNNQFRGGMQVHAVPEEERSYDAQGRRLPWAYLHADGSLNRKHTLEKGPFGRTTRNHRSISRSKTATPATKEDLLRTENHAYQDQLFTRTKAELAEQSPVREQKQSTANNFAPPRLPIEPSTASGLATAPAGPNVNTIKEPTEVILYGFAPEYQYAAIDFFETVSKGRIYEDYDRLPPHPRYNTYLSNTRSTLPRSLPRETIRKINEYQGGNNWVKVTFDSPEAAELACHSSPHVLHGYSVYAEPYRGTGPNADVPLAVTSANRGGASTLTHRKPAVFASPSNTSGTMPARLHQLSSLTSGDALPAAQQSPPPTSLGSGYDVHQALSKHQSAAEKPSDLAGAQQVPQSLRIATAKRVILRPATEALLPIAPWPQRAFKNIPVFGPILFGSESSTVDVIGAAVPVTENGEFDWVAATFWWKLCWVMDLYLKTNICGLRGD